MFEQPARVPVATSTADGCSFFLYAVIPHRWVVSRELASPPFPFVDSASALSVPPEPTSLASASLFARLAGGGPARGRSVRLRLPIEK